MRYLDTGGRDAEQSLYRWLEQTLPGASYFACQTGYFSGDGIYPLEKHFLDLFNVPGEMHLVVGANEAGVRSDDLTYVLDLYDQAPTGATTTLTVVAADDVLMHPKTYYVERPDGSRHALVGSVNLTHPGLSRNMEAAIALSSADEPQAPFDAIRDAVLAWEDPARVNAYPVDRAAIGTLITEGILDVPKKTSASPSPKAKTARKKYFPSVGALIKLPRRRRAVTPRVKVTKPVTPQPVPVGTLVTMPAGYVGIIKRLSPRSDVKKFHGGSGTAYIALPKEVAPYLPMTPRGANDEPRVDITIEARLDSVPDQVAMSGAAETNITHVGEGKVRKSNTDLRLNYLEVITKGIEYIANGAGVPVPKGGDLAAIEFVDGVRVKITFIADPTSIANLEPLLDQRRNGWGWLPPDVIGSWDADDDPQE
jgi:hypothetical protein